MWAEAGKDTRQPSKPKAIWSNAMQDERAERLAGQISDKKKFHDDKNKDKKSSNRIIREGCREERSYYSAAEETIKLQISDAAVVGSNNFTREPVKTNEHNFTSTGTKKILSTVTRLQSLANCPLPLRNSRHILHIVQLQTAQVAAYGFSQTDFVIMASLLDHIKTRIFWPFLIQVCRTKTHNSHIQNEYAPSGMEW
ncbi:hypothetical protein EXN66_Car018379 [Channa argus]|uniref:Uncharacterized protein n=1 Tax=Channa argus TaxID=215402 RepID=A0A6G1QJ38_CHAAH|nr:hypothetical protein EXN66_Car018379 [Channa argus]